MHSAQLLYPAKAARLCPAVLYVGTYTALSADVPANDTHRPYLNYAAPAAMIRVVEVAQCEDSSLLLYGTQNEPLSNLPTDMEPRRPFL